MPFFARQKIIYPPFQFSSHREPVIDDDGNVNYKQVNDNSPLPNKELFDLAHQLKSGVPVRQVSTKILGSDNAVSDCIAHFNQQTQTKE